MLCTSFTVSALYAIQSRLTSYHKIISDSYISPHFIHNSTLGGLKNQLLKFNGCPIRSHSIGLEKLRTVFVFALAHLEGPPLALFCFNGNYNGKTAKILLADSQMEINGQIWPKWPSGQNGQNDFLPFSH